jgi:hypothetical protein
LIHFCRPIAIKHPIKIDIVKEFGTEFVGFAAVVGFLILGGVDFIKVSHPDIEILSLIR